MGNLDYQRDELHVHLRGDTSTNAAEWLAYTGPHGVPSGVSDGFGQGECTPT